MTKWTTLRFISDFLNNSLGRKKVHGTYRVLDGDHCKLLVRAITAYGTPSGNELIAIDLSNEDTKMVFWRTGYSSNFTYSMARRLERETAAYQTLPALVLTGDEENLLHSGVVAIDSTHTLIEIGDKPFLLHRDNDNDYYTHANQIPKRVASILEALEQVKDPVDDRKICKEWWAQEMPSEFVPPEFNPELVKVLSTALNPIDFGFSIDDCRIGTVSGSKYGTTSLRSFIPSQKIIKANTQTTKVQKWTEAVVKWSEAADSLLNRKPAMYKGLSVQNSRFVSLSNDEDRRGTILITDQGVYITGEIHSHSDWVQSDTLTKWYKLTQHANQINIPKCT